MTTLDKAYALITVTTLIAIVYAFVFKHLPIVGWNYILENLQMYLLTGFCFFCFFAMSYGMSKVCERLSELYSDGPGNSQEKL